MQHYCVIEKSQSSKLKSRALLQVVIFYENIIANFRTFSMDWFSSPLTFMSGYVDSGQKRDVSQIAKICAQQSR